MLSYDEINRRNTRLRNAVLLNRECSLGSFSIHIEYFIYHNQETPFRTPVHTHSFWELSRLAQASTDYHIQQPQKTVSLNQNDNSYVLIPPGWKHFRENRESNALILGFMLAISGKTPEDDRRLLKRTGELNFRLNGSPLSVLRDLENNLAAEENVLAPEETGLRIRLLLLTIFRNNFGNLFEKTSPEQRYRNPVWLAENHISENLNRPLPAGELAALCKLSRRQFYRCFEAEYGMPVNEFIRARRIRLAAHELIHSDATMKEIAASAGFQNMSYFIRQFKQNYSITPGQFRLRYRNV